MLKLRKFSVKNFDLEFNLSAEIRVRVIERPGRWMNAEQQCALVGDLRKVVAQVGMGSIDYGILSGDPARLSQAVITLLYRGKDPVAFNAISLLPCVLRGHVTEVMHLGLVVIDPRFRSGGFSWVLYGFTSFLIFARHRFKPFWISSVTQVPAVFGMVSEGFRDVYPAPPRKGIEARRSFDQLMLAREIMAKHRDVFGVGARATFDEAGFVIQDGYTEQSASLKKTYATASKHRVERYNSYCEGRLNYERGDDFLQIGLLTMGSFARYITEMVPRGFLATVITKFVTLFTESLLSPVLQWFSPSLAMGDIRPYER